ncbi:MAG: pyruvate:ferredoxin (flavodoxin) oxidoreductase [Allisonella histaminiformans]|uniref:pyruvate:ferredoxin (flavodoxin) oxidoreductase n=1 Tax=Allisonella histaminiformans TaxID=209880 RepID=UPI002355B3DD|nr:pyruvate:ferredoxin (flavodoxin) oxidoreductase [Allisonella histaminiformans]MCI6003029.1 pyruvate:ferredoxin (flavodoxin) oxidoreductase [Allisonella histaminiformans]
MDGNTAAAYISYAFTEVAAIYPITPSSPMAEMVDEWAAHGKKNIFGDTVHVVEMQAESGAAGAFHGALESGALTSTYTASQGMLLMLPNMYKVAGELLPGVFHIAARALANHALSIFGDHQDVMSARATGCAMLAESNPQEIMDLSAIAHLAAIKGRVPFINFFDGFRTSHEIQKVEVLNYDELEPLIDKEALARFRKHSMTPNHPVIRGTAENPDVYFQHCEAANPFYLAIPDIVQGYMDDIARLTGRHYHLFDYYGAKDAERVIISIGSVSDIAKDVTDALLAKGEKVGVMNVHLYRPFSVKHFLSQLPESVKKIAVLDRTREPGAIGEPLYLDVQSAVAASDRDIRVIGGRYGLGSKDVIPEDIMAVFEHLKADRPRHNFTLGITDDVTHLSLAPVSFPQPDDGCIACKFWGFGSDGTVGANKNAIKIIGDNTDMYAQGYFSYDSRKSGGVTISHLRFGPNPIRKPYLITQANYIACHRPSYIYKYDLLKGLKPGGTFVLNSRWSAEELDQVLPASMKRKLAALHARFYIINAFDIARKIGLGGRINMVMQAAFFHLTGILPDDKARELLYASIEHSYGRKGQNVVDMNCHAVDAGMENIVEVPVPAEWEHATTGGTLARIPRPAFVSDVCDVMNRQEGDSLPVSTFTNHEDGTMTPGTTKYERAATAINVPEWIPEHCIGCNQCSVVCPHAAIRPFLVTEDEAANAPEGFIVKDFRGPVKGLKYRIIVSQEDCVGCGLCANVCPTREKSLVMKPIDTQIEKQKYWDYAISLPVKENPLRPGTLQWSQYQPSYFEFSGACAGCGETPYIHMVTSLFGDRMMIANATGCSSIYGASAPSMPYTTDHNGHGPAWANSLFEDNAEFGLGMLLGENKLRERLTRKVEDLLPSAEGETREAMEDWLSHRSEGAGTRQRAQRLETALESAVAAHPEYSQLLELKDHFIKKSQWIFGGDGWAYDIGFGGLDQVLASGEDINVLVLDTEVYSNTGGQSSKSTPAAAIAKFAASGKKTKKKDLGMIAISYGYIYVAQIALGADMNQAFRAIAEAEAYPGPSLIICYSPCINHGIRKGMGHSIQEEKEAVQCGYWCNYRYNPQLREQGKNPFHLDSRPPKGNFRDFLLGEVRFSSLQKLFPEEAEALFEKTERDAMERRQNYVRLQKSFDMEIKERKEKEAAEKAEK